MKKIYWLVATSSFVLFISCQREINDIITTAQQCKIVTGYYYGGSGGINDSALFTYTNDKVTRVEDRDEYVTYFYNGNNISIRKFYEKPGDLFWSIDSIEYNSSNKITRLINWSYPSSFTYDTTRIVYTFTYQDSKLSKVIESEELLNLPPDTSIYIFNTNAAGNLDHIYITDADNNVYDSISYYFDANPNYFKIVHPHFFLLDPFFELHVGLVPHFPYFYSQNNVVRFTVYGNIDYPIVYGLDSSHHMTSLDMGGFEYMKYKYQCPQ